MRKETIQKWLIQKSWAWFSFVQVASHLQPSNHEAPKPHRLRMGVKPVTRSGGWELGRQNCRCPEGSLAYKWQSLDLRQGYFNQQSRSSALSPLPLVFKISEYVMDVHGAEFRRYKVTQWKVSLLILSSCHSISFLIQPTHIPGIVPTFPSVRIDHFTSGTGCCSQGSALCLFHFHRIRHFWFPDFNDFNHPATAAFSHTNLVIFPLLSFAYFSLSSSLPSFSFISSFLSPSIHLEIDEVIIRVETDFWKNGLHEIFDPTKWFFGGRLSAKYFRKLKPFLNSFHSHSHWLG